MNDLLGWSTIEREKNQEPPTSEHALHGSHPREKKGDIIAKTHQTGRELGLPTFYPTTFTLTLNGVPDFVGNWQATKWEVAYHKRRGAKITGLRRLRH